MITILFSWRPYVRIDFLTLMTVSKIKIGFPANLRGPVIVSNNQFILYVDCKLYIVSQIAGIFQTVILAIGLFENNKFCKIKNISIKSQNF